MAHGPIPDKPEQLIEETEAVLKATAASEDFAQTMEQVSTTLATTPGVAARWAALIKRNATQ
jgi:hypothetical protein